MERWREGGDSVGRGWQVEGTWAHLGTASAQVGWRVAGASWWQACTGCGFQVRSVGHGVALEGSSGWKPLWCHRSAAMLA